MRHIDQLFLKIVTLIACLGPLSAATSAPQNLPPVEWKRVPDGGLQPQVTVDHNGVAHLVFFKGDPSAGDLFYAQSRDGASFSPPIQVNSVPGSAVALGNIRGARIATGRRGQVYIVWNGSTKMGQDNAHSPMFFSRLNQSGTAFEPERNLIHTAYGIDGGGGIAADEGGRVYVFWHAPMPGSKGEDSRRIWMTRSLDDGATFQPEQVAWNQPTGTCGCCSLNSYADPAGNLYVLFRAAHQMVHRDMYLLASADHGVSFRGSDVSKWDVGYCVMSSEAFASENGQTIAAWETQKQIHFGTIHPALASASDAVVSTTGTNQKYPSLAMNHAGLLLVSWTEGMSWKHGGSAHWQLFDKAFHRVGETGAIDGVPAWSLVSAYSKPDGSFVVLY